MCVFFEGIELIGFCKTLLFDIVVLWVPRQWFVNIFPETGGDNSSYVRKYCFVIGFLFDSNGKHGHKHKTHTRDDLITQTQGHDKSLKSRIRGHMDISLWVCASI